MNEKFTPGPWYMEFPERFSDCVITAKSRIEMVDICEIDSVYQDTRPESEFEEEQLANANLIAAAPELYEALKDLVEIAEPNIYPQPDKPNSNWAKLKAAQAALAKARGE